MRANKTNTTDKFTLVREIIEEAKIGATGKLVADIGFLNVIKYFLNKDNLYVQQENVIEEYHADTINTGIKQTLVENNVMYKENDV